MNIISKHAYRFARFVKNIGRDTRGEDFATPSSMMSRAGVVVVVGGVLTGVGAGATTAVNNMNSGQDTMHTKIGKISGAPTDTTKKVTASFGGGGGGGE